MTALPNYPKVSQLTGIRPNPDPDPNGPMDCVEASVGSAILYYQGKVQWDGTINPDALKNAAYGLYYTGATAASRLIPFCEKLGYKLYSVAGNQVQLVQLAHSYIRSGHPVIFTEPDPYSKAPGWSHVCVFHAERPGYLTCLDPYIAEYIERPDQQWENMLLFGQIWILEDLNGGNTLLQLNSPMGQHYTEVAANRWHCKPTNVDLAYAHLSFYRQFEGVFGLPLTNEIYLAQLPGTAIVVYERAIAIYDPKHSVDNPPGSGSVYLMHINSGTGQQIIAKPLVTTLQSQVDALKAEAAKPSADLNALNLQLASYQAAINQMDTIISQMKGKNV